MTKVPKKIMIIVWKWDFLPDHLNAVLARQKYGNKLPDFATGKGQYYDEYQVEKSLLCPEALLVAARIYKDGEQTMQILEQLIEHYLPNETEADECQVMLFLHRNNDFKENDVTFFLNKYSKRLYKAFLFAQGRDYIYSNAEKQHIGLLNHMGEFAYGYHQASDEKYFVADRNRKLVFQPFFDRIWSYYDIEFETKVFELKEDLFDCLYGLFLPDEPTDLSQELIVEKLKECEDGLLWYRLKSFMNKYKKENKDPEDLDSFVEEGLEMSKLKEAEKEKGKSYFFDDCIANLERERLNDRDFVSQEYEEIKNQMHDLFLDTDRKTIGIQDLQNVGAKLNYLVKIIPGVMD